MLKKCNLYFERFESFDFFVFFSMFFYVFIANVCPMAVYVCECLLSGLKVKLAIGEGEHVLLMSGC